MSKKNEFCEEPVSIDLGRVASNCTLRNSLHACQQHQTGLINNDSNAKDGLDIATDEPKTKKESIDSNLILINYRLRHNQSVELSAKEGNHKDFMVSEIIIPKLEFDILQSPSSKIINKKRIKKSKFSKIGILIAVLIILVVMTIGFIIVALINIVKANK